MNLHELEKISELDRFPSYAEFTVFQISANYYDCKHNTKLNITFNTKSVK